MQVGISIHAKRRFKERTGLPARAVRSHARKALTHGKALDQLHFDSRRRLGDMSARHAPGEETTIRVLGGVAYVFADDWRAPGSLVLVTVLPSYEEFE